MLLLEYHSKLNTLDANIFAMTRQALTTLQDDRWVGLVIGNQGQDFCAGANILEIVTAAQTGQWEAIDASVRTFHELQQALRYSSKPVVTAPFARVLGGGTGSRCIVPAPSPPENPTSALSKLASA